jgi:hypothetical protein
MQSSCLLYSRKRTFAYLLTFGHGPAVGGTGADSGGAGCGDGVVGAGAGFGARFLDFALLAGFAIFIPFFFFRAGAPRFAFLDFFATFNIPNRNHATTAQPLI